MECSLDERPALPATAGKSGAPQSTLHHIGQHPTAIQHLAWSGESVSDGSLDYCRKARRLRARLTQKRHLLHEQLRRLKVCDAPRLDQSQSSCTHVVIKRLDVDRINLTAIDTLAWPESGRVSSKGIWGDETDDHTSRCGSFADYITEQTTGPILPYETRLAFLHEASRRGIGRFEANLVIAAVQHRKANEPRASTYPARRRNFGMIAVFAIVQSLILVGIYRIMHG